MPSIEASIRTHLLADATVAGLLDARIRPLRMAQKEGTGPRPCLVYSVGDDDVKLTHSGAGQHHKAEFEATVFADSHDDCADLARQVKRVLHGFNGDVAGIHVAVMIFENETATEEAQPAQGSPIFVRTQTYRVLYRDA